MAQRPKAPAKGKTAEPARKRAVRRKATEKRTGDRAKREVPEDKDIPISTTRSPATLHPPVYAVSDFHLGSDELIRVSGGAVEKAGSNNMDIHTLRDFLQWLEWIDQTDSQGFPHYHVVMNGDFLDLWQAARPASRNDTYRQRLTDIINTNIGFFSDLTRFLASHPRCRFTYVIGNHDDALYSGSDDADSRFRRNENYRDLRRRFQRHMSRLVRNRLVPIHMVRRYTNSAYELMIEHGHQYDRANRRDDDEPSRGQRLVEEHVNPMEELVIGDIYQPFENIDYTPSIETARYLNCLVEHSRDRRILDLIDAAQHAAVEAAIGPLLHYWAHHILGITDADERRRTIRALDPEEVKREYRDHAEEALDDNSAHRIVVFGHTHHEDVRGTPLRRGNWASANTGTWLRRIRFRRQGRDCLLLTEDSPYPFIKISDAGNDITNVELRYHRGGGGTRTARVWRR